MKYLVYLITLLFSTAVAQNPTILQGNYVSNVFGQANFVLNPNAQTNIANVTVSSATVARSTTTPLVATSEFNITTSTSTGSATWATRTFDAGMKNQNCEARFTYRGFAVGSTKAQLIQNSLVVAELTLTPATDPRIASINFPCGDLSNATTFRLQQATASLTGTNEIGGIYVGLATNQANVAQAEMIVHAKSNTSQTINNGTTITLILDSEIYDPQDYYNPTTGVFTAKKPGNYVFTTRIVPQTSEADAQWYLSIRKNGASVGQSQNVTIPYSPGGNTSVLYPGISPLTNQIELNTGDTVEIRFSLAGGANTQLLSGYSNMVVTRFPSASELVVTPERQNTFAGVQHTGGNQTLFGGSADPTAFSSFNSSAWNQPTRLKGKAAVTTTNSGNDLGFSVPNLPVGNYEIKISGAINALPGANAAGNYTICNYRIRETTTDTTALAYQHNAVGNTDTGTRDYVSSAVGIFTNTSVATRNFIVEASKFADTNASNNGICEVYTNSSPTGSSYNTYITITLTPLDQPSNSALYVQGPVKAAATGDAIPTGYLGKSEFGGGRGIASNLIGSQNTTLYTISNVTPGVYFVRLYGASDRAGVLTATYGFWTCNLTTNASETGNWYDYIGSPQTKIGMSNGNYGGSHLASFASNWRIVSVTSTSTYYMRCFTESNNSGMGLSVGAEFIRIN